MMKLFVCIVGSLLLLVALAKNPTTESDGQPYTGVQVVSATSSGSAYKMRQTNEGWVLVNEPPSLHNTDCMDTSNETSAEDGAEEAAQMLLHPDEADTSTWLKATQRSGCIHPL